MCYNIFKKKKLTTAIFSERWWNFVRLFCFMLTNTQALIWCGVDLTDQPVLVHIWKLCYKCHRGQGCPASERHLL